MAAKWVPWLYQYSVGGLLFFATLWAAMRCGALRREDFSDRWLLRILVAGFFAFLVVHGFWIVAVP